MNFFLAWQMEAPGRDFRGSPDIKTDELARLVPPASTRTERVHPSNHTRKPFRCMRARALLSSSGHRTNPTEFVHTATHAANQYWHEDFLRDLSDHVNAFQVARVQFSDA